MQESPTATGNGYKIEVSADGSTLTLAVEANGEVSAASVIAQLKEMKLTSFDDGKVIEAIEKRKGEAISLIIAKGAAAVDERPERLEYRVPVADGESRTIVKVEADKVVAMIAPPVAGINGRDVFGEPIVAGKGERSFEIGRNLKAVKGAIIATAAGNLRLKDKVLSVEPLLELRGDEGRLEPINFDGDAVVKGSLSGGSKLQLSGCLTVGGAIESIQLKTGGSVHVTGGIIGSQRGNFVIGGGLRCRFITGACIMTGGDVHVQSEIINARISSGGRLTVARGPIHGGAVAAQGGISCQVLGHTNGSRTIVEAGHGAICQSFLASIRVQIEANKKRVKEVRAKIEPLLAQMKHLTPPQREKATELLYDAQEMEEATEQMVADLEKQTNAVKEKECAEIIVTEVSYPGVTVRFPGIQTVLSTALKGPFTLAPHKADGITEIFLIDGNDGTKTVLPSHRIGMPEPAVAA